MGKSKSINHNFDAENSASQQKFATAIDGVDDRMAMFDAEDRLAFGNKSWWDEQAKFGLAPKIGDRYRDYAASLAASKFITRAVGGEEEWVKLRLEQRGNPDETNEAPLADGEVALVRDHGLPDGSTLTITTTITACVAAERALAASEQSFQNLAAQSIEGIVVHRDNPPILCQPSVRRHDRHGKSSRCAGDGIDGRLSRAVRKRAYGVIPTPANARGIGSGKL